MSPKKELPTISLKEIMRGSGVRMRAGRQKKVVLEDHGSTSVLSGTGIDGGYLPGQVYDLPIEGGKISAKRLYKKSGMKRVVTKIAKDMAPVLKSEMKHRVKRGLKDMGMSEGQAEMLGQLSSDVVEREAMGRLAEEGVVEGGKVGTVKRVGRVIRRTYKRHVKPVVSQTLKTLKPVAESLASEAVQNALVSQGLPPMMADAAGQIAAQAASNVVSDVLNKTGVTSGLGLKMPNFKARVTGDRVAPAYLGAGLVTVQTSSKNKAAMSMSNMSGLVQSAARPSDIPSAHIKNVPVQVQNTARFSNMSIGRGLYLAGGRGLY